MTIRRVVPDIASSDLSRSREFYIDVLGFELSMDIGWIMTFASPANPTAQVSIIDGHREPGGAPAADLTIEVADVDAVHARAIGRHVEVVYPLTDEPWGVRRFFVRDPDGKLINVMSHLRRSPEP